MVYNIDMELCNDCGINKKHISKTNKKYSYCIKCTNVRSKEAQKKYFSSEAGKEKVRLSTRAYQRKKNGFTAELFGERLILQNYLCAICKKDIDETSHADHNHDTGMPRGILCHGCNTLLGRIESVGFGWIEKAKKYLKDYE